MPTTESHLHMIHVENNGTFVTGNEKLDCSVGIFTDHEKRESLKRVQIDDIVGCIYVDMVYDYSSKYCSICAALPDESILLSKCTCKQRRYCSKECQKADWTSGHKFSQYHRKMNKSVL